MEDLPYNFQILLRREYMDFFCQEIFIAVLASVSERLTISPLSQNNHVNIKK